METGEFEHGDHGATVPIGTWIWASVEPLAVDGPSWWEECRGAIGAGLFGLAVGGPIAGIGAALLAMDITARLGSDETR